MEVLTTMSNSKNKIRYGLKNVHYSVITKSEAGAIEYAKPVHFPGAVSLTLDAETGDLVKFFADDEIYFSGAGTNQGYSGTLEMASGDARDDFDCAVMGFKKDTNGLIFENADAKASNFALLFEFQGDQSGMRYVVYNCSAARTSLSGATKKETINVATDSYSLTATPAENSHHVQAKCKKGQTGYDNFFDAVVLPAEVAA